MTPRTKTGSSHWIKGQNKIKNKKVKFSRETTLAHLFFLNSGGFTGFVVNVKVPTILLGRRNTKLLYLLIRYKYLTKLASSIFLVYLFLHIFVFKLVFFFFKEFLWPYFIIIIVIGFLFSVLQSQSKSMVNIIIIIILLPSSLVILSNHATLCVTITKWKFYIKADFFLLLLKLILFFLSESYWNNKKFISSMLMLELWLI